MAPTIPSSSLIISFLPLLFVFIFFLHWSLNWKKFLYATTRMITQLLVVGYLLTFFFEKNHPGVSVLIVTAMLVAASWIAINPISRKKGHFLGVLISMFLGAIPVLLLVTTTVLPQAKWFEARFLIPIGGMILANSMNMISLALERYQRERADLSLDGKTVRARAFQAAMIPKINSFLAVGIVSLPGMMTGQILSGVDPLLAIRYQIVVMTMIMGASGISTGLYLSFFVDRFENS